MTDSNNVSGGLAGKILRVNLSNGTVRTEATGPYARRFIGGRAINSYLLFGETNPGTKWNDTDNLLIFGAGALVGTLAPSACRVSIDSINVFNNGKGSANFGGQFGAELKYAGYDHIVITGRAESPVYLCILDDKVEIKSAAGLRGKTTWETEEAIRQELGDNRIELACIGPAGENQVRGSGIFTSPGKAAGGCGVGCVMGNKKLKAIAVRGHNAIRPAEPERFMSAVDKALCKIMAVPGLKSWRQGSIVHRLLPDSPTWNSATCRNGQDDYWPMPKRQNLVGPDKGVPGFHKRVMSCFDCAGGCMPYSEINQGEYAGTHGIGYWINSAHYSTRLDMDDAAASLRYHLRLNELGLDGDACTAAIGWLIECYEKGIISGQEIGFGLKWGDAKTILQLQEMMAYRQGIGDLLADGVVESSRRLGKGSEAFAIHMKGQDSVECFRIGKGWGFGVAVSLIGGRHLRGAVATPESMGPKGLKWSPKSYENIPEAVYWQARTKEIEDMLGICIYAGTWSGLHALEVADYAELLSSCSGTDYSEADLMTAGVRGINLEKAFNTLNTGLGRQDDLPPRRYIEEPVKQGPFSGSRCDPDKWEEMIDRYYELLGWDKKTGLQTRRNLEGIGLKDIARKLDEAGRFGFSLAT